METMETAGQRSGISKRADLEQQMGVLQTKLNRLYEAIESGVDARDIAPRVAQLSQAKRDLEAELLSVGDISLPTISPQTKSDAVTFLQGLIKNATAEELMRVLRHIDFRVTLKPDYTATITVNPAYLISETSRVFVEQQFWQTIGTRATNIVLFAA